jgi:Ca2+-binding EF-hand superfamily protein
MLKPKVFQPASLKQVLLGSTLCASFFSPIAANETTDATENSVRQNASTASVNASSQVASTLSTKRSNPKKNAAKKQGQKQGKNKAHQQGKHPLQNGLNAAQWLLDTYDIDQDGRLSAEERQAAVDDPQLLVGLQKHTQKWAEHLEQNDSPNKRAKAIARLMRLHMLAQQHDNDADGTLSHEERQRLRKHLKATMQRRQANLSPKKRDQYDLDGDGALSEQELANWRAAKARRWQRRLEEAPDQNPNRDLNQNPAQQQEEAL